MNAGDRLCEIDILLPVKGGRFDLYEVKSSTGLKDEFLPDIAFQAHVARKAGLDIRKCHLITINSGYVRRGEIREMELFTVQDVTQEIAPHVAEVPANVLKAQKIIASKTCPNIRIGSHCADCPLKKLPNLCWKNVHAEPTNIFDLYRLPSKRAFGWFHDGFLKSAELPDDYPLSDKQGIQIKAEKSKKPHLNQKAIREFCKRLQFPLFFLDFETFASPIPMLDQSRPYEAIPFQFSLHIIRKNLDEKPQHISWIWEGDVPEDPREEMLHCLMHLLERKGSIVAYNAPFEKGVLKQAVALYPDYADAFKSIMGASLTCWSHFGASPFTIRPSMAPRQSRLFFRHGAAKITARWKFRMGNRLHGNTCGRCLSRPMPWSASGSWRIWKPTADWIQAAWWTLRGSWPR